MNQQLLVTTKTGFPSELREAGLFLRLAVEVHLLVASSLHAWEAPGREFARE
jgi:hypothetical protein